MQHIKPTEPKTPQPYNSGISPNHRNRRLFSGNDESNYMLHLEDQCYIASNNIESEEDEMEGNVSLGTFRNKISSKLSAELTFLRSLPNHAHRSRFELLKGTDKRHDWTSTEKDPQIKAILNDSLLSPRKQNKVGSSFFDAAVLRADAAEDAHTNPEKEISFIAEDVSQLLFENRTETILGLIKKGNVSSKEFQPRAYKDLLKYYNRLREINPQLANKMEKERKNAELQINRQAILRNCFRRLKLCCIQERFERIEREKNSVG